MLWFIRHSERLDAAIGKTKWYNMVRGKENVSDPPLSEPNGYTIAKTKIELLLNEYTGGFDYIYTSPADRCVGTSVVFQNFIKEKYNVVIPIRVEYGLIYTSSGSDENWFTPKEHNRIKLVNDEFIIDDPLVIGTDDHMMLKNIIKRYLDNIFDKKYISHMTPEETQNEYTFGKSIENRIRIAKYMASIISSSLLTLAVTHGEMLTILECYGNKEWNYIEHRKLFGGDDNYCSCVKFNVDKKRLIYDGHITYGKK